MNRQREVGNGNEGLTVSFFQGCCALRGNSCRYIRGKDSQKDVWICSFMFRTRSGCAVCSWC